MTKFTLLLVFLLSCSGNNIQANQCATANSSYIVQSVEKSGNCGSIVDELINVNPNKNIVTNGVNCEEYYQNECTERKTNCVFSKDDLICSKNTMITFEPDGSKASGVMALTCHNYLKQSCSSTYMVQFTRL